MQSTKLLTIIFSMIIFTGITASTTAFAESDDQNTLDSITDIEFRTVTDFHTYLPDSHISFDVSCNQLAGEFAIGFNTYIEKSDGSPADVNDVRNLVFLQRGSSDSGAFIDAVNTGPDRLKLTAEVTCAKLLPVPLPTVPDAPTEFSVTTGDQVAKLIWKEPEFDGDSPITTYQISAKPDPLTSAASNVFAETADTFFTFDGLVNGITYKFQVNAVNDVGPGIASEIITGTLLAPYVPAPTPTIILTTEKTA
ncbi:MAG: fibronectin type III domain-containing protein, partial [Nitrosopumilus sp.]